MALATILILVPVATFDIVVDGHGATPDICGNVQNTIV